MERSTNKRAIFVTLSQAALELSTSRETLRRRLIEAGVGPDHVARAHDMYRLRDVLKAWTAPAESDPTKLSAFARKAFFQAAHEEVRLAEKAGRLIPADDVRRTFGETFQMLAQSLSTVPDIVERAGGSLRIVQAVDEAMTQLRRELAQRMREPTPEAVSHGSDRPAHPRRSNATVARIPLAATAAD
jgi:hypothetical protein